MLSNILFYFQSKKNKKKSKSDAKAVQNSSRHDGKEVDEGTWASERTIEKSLILFLPRFIVTKLHLFRLILYLALLFNNYRF